MNNNHKVSIIIPVYNGANYLAEAIDSALNQTYKNIEILVINDGSKDDGATERIALSYGDKIRYISKENGGVSSALNRGIREMRGEYFSWLSHDDLYMPNKIEREISAIKTDNDIVLCSGSLMNADGKLMKHHTKLIDKRLDGRNLFKAFLNGYVLNGLGFLIPRHVFEKVGTFDERMRYLQDLDLWLRMMWYDYEFVCLSDLLVVSRIHKNQTTNLASDQFDVDREALAKKHSGMLNDEDIEEKPKILKLYMLLFEKSNNKEGIRDFSRLLQKNKIGIFDLYPMIIRYRLLGLISNSYRWIRDKRLMARKMRS